MPDQYFSNLSRSFIYKESLRNCHKIVEAERYDYKMYCGYSGWDSVTEKEHQEKTGEIQ